MMDTNRMHEIARTLAKLYVARSFIIANIAATEENLADREFHLTPPEGWAGKNEAERTVSKLRALEADESATRLKAYLRKEKRRLQTETGHIEALEAERRAYEWETRAMMARNDLRALESDK